MLLVWLFDISSVFDFSPCFHDEKSMNMLLVWLFYVASVFVKTQKFQILVNFSVFPSGLLLGVNIVKAISQNELGGLLSNLELTLIIIT